MPFGQQQSDTVTHIVSILSLLFGMGFVNYFEFSFIKELTQTVVYAIVLQNATFAVMMAYYAVRYAITPSGVTIQTDPTAPIK